MIVKRPSIFIYAHMPDDEKLKEICAGIEEEGVFYEVFIKDDCSDLSTLAFDSASDSMMGTGIGISSDAVALHMKGIEKGKYVEFYQSPSFCECRKIGADSARIIKKMPLK